MAERGGDKASVAQSGGDKASVAQSGGDKAPVAQSGGPVAQNPLPPPAAPAQPAWRRPKPATAAPRVFTVSELTWQIKDLLEPPFARVLVRGEVSGFRGTNTRGHVYFSIKDGEATIDVRVWQTTARGLKFKLKDGLSVIIEGSLSVYEPQGRYALIVQKIEPEGVGAMALAFEQLKQKLAAEGLIGDKRTKPRKMLPFLPRRIGVVTSISGAALRDFLKVLHRRHPRMSVLVADARVQGDGAMFEVRRAIRSLWRTDVDVIVVARGGGSVDDLWTFNEEAIVRTIFDSPIPVVSAVGHEIDTTLSDLVADVRAPTPSAAAELVVPELASLELQVAGLRLALVRSVEKQLLARRTTLKLLGNALGDPRRVLSQERLRLTDASERLARRLRRAVRQRSDGLRALATELQRVRPQAQLRARTATLADLRTRLEAVVRRQLVELRARLGKLSVGLERGSPRPALRQARVSLEGNARVLPLAIARALRKERQRLAQFSANLNAMSPLAVLGRGYAIARRSDGQVVREASQVVVGDDLSVTIGAGDQLTVAVTQVKPAAK